MDNFSLKLTDTALALLRADIAYSVVLSGYTLAILGRDDGIQQTRIDNAVTDGIRGEIAATMTVKDGRAYFSNVEDAL